VAAVRHSLIVGTAFAMCAGGGCVSQDTSPYPPDWPPLARASSCSDIGGQYRNAATGTTLWLSPTMPVTSRAFLSHLLLDGTPRSLSEAESTEQFVVIDSAKRSYSVHRPGDFRGFAGLSSGQWECRSSGELTLRFERDSKGEGSMGRIHILLALRKASDGSLIAHGSYKIRGVSWGVIPSGDDSEDWYRFNMVSGN
jgi:hypothetical protein